MKQWQQAAQTESRDSQWQFPDKYCHTHIINVLADVEPSLSHAVIWESSTETEQADAEVYGSVAGFGNGLLEQEADGHGCCVERVAGWSGRALLISLSRADVASCAEQRYWSGCASCWDSL